MRIVQSLAVTLLVCLSASVAGSDIAVSGLARYPADARLIPGQNGAHRGAPGSDPARRGRQYMDPAVAETIVRETHAMGAYRVVLCGDGEPTLHPDFDRILDLITQLNMEP